MKPKKTHTQAIHVQSHDWATENQQLRKELLSREKRIEELEAMASTLNNQLSEKIDQINDMMQKMISFMTTNRDATLLESLRQSVVAEIAENGGYPPTQNGDIRSLFWLFSLMALQN